MALLAVPAAADEFFYRVEAERLQCIAAHVDDYLSEGGDIVYINPDACPPDSAPALGNVVRNEAPDMKFSGDDDLDPLLVLLPEQLLCLSNFAVPNSEGILRFYPESCDVSTDLQD